MVKKLSLLVLTACLLLTLAVVQSEAQEPVLVFWETGPPPEGGWTVGDPIPLRLRASYRASFEVVLPELPAQWGPFEVREQTLLDPIAQDDGSVIAVREATVVLWSPGEHETPPFAAGYRSDDGQPGQVRVPPITITVASVLPEGEGGQDGSIEKHDLKPQASLPEPPVWPWLLLSMLAAAPLFLAGRWLMDRLRRPESVEPGAAVLVKDERFPEEIAYDELDRITALDLPVQGEFKRHYTLVTDCARVYVQGIYPIPAMDRTTAELLSALRSARITGEPLSLLRPLLQEADLVKFAKLEPPVKQAGAAITQARRLVDVTKPDRTPVDEQAITQHATRNTE